MVLGSSYLQGQRKLPAATGGKCHRAVPLYYLARAQCGCADFAGNVAKPPAASGSGKAVPAPDKSHTGSGGSGRVAVKLEVAEGDLVSLTCTEL